MKNKFIISQQAIELMQQLHDKDTEQSLSIRLHDLDGQPHLDVIQWLKVREYPSLAVDIFHSSRFIRESLRTALLQDLSRSYFGMDEITEQALKEDRSWLGKIKLGILALAGTIYNICNGFDGSVSILTLFIGIPNWTVFVVGLALSLVFVVLFYNFDLVEISDNVHVRIYHSRRLLDVYVEQAELINDLIEQSKQLIKGMNNEFLDELSADLNNVSDVFERLSGRRFPLPKDARRSFDRYFPQDFLPNVANDDSMLDKQQYFDEALQLLDMLIARQQDLCCIRQIYMKELDHIYVRVMKLMATIITGLLYFNYGFFAGQVLSVVVLSAFLAASISVTSWPVILISIAVGLAALSIFWYTDERPRVENLVGRWIGLDLDKINRLPVGDQVESQKTERDQLEKQIRLEMKMHQRFLFWGNRGASSDSESLQSTLPTNLSTG